MKKRVTFLSCLLVIILLIGTLASCAGDPTESTAQPSSQTSESESVSSSEPATESESQSFDGTDELTTTQQSDPESSEATESSELASETETESKTETESTTETESKSETETETERTLDTSPLTLPEEEDLYPDYTELETIEIYDLNAGSAQIKVEGEKFDSINMPTKNVSDSCYSGGQTLRVHCGASSLENGWEGSYSVSYKITVTEAGVYELQAVTHMLKATYTSDFKITIDGEKVIDAPAVGKIMENIPAIVDGRADNSLIKLYSFGNVELSAGEHTVTFNVDTADAQASQDRVILFIDYFTLDKVSSQNKIEGEDYESINLKTNNLVHSDYSAGKALRVFLTASQLEKGWNELYTVSYKFTVSETATYELQALNHKLQEPYTSDFTITIDDSLVIDAAKAGVILEDRACTVDGKVDKSLMKVYSYGEVELAAGEHTITFTIDNADSEASQNRIIFYLDYFAFSKNIGIKEGFSLDYGVPITGEDSEIIKNAAIVNVYDCRFPLELSIGHLFETSGELNYSIVNYFGETLYEGKLSGEAGQMISLTRSIKNHPTGYFMLTVGEEMTAYVVTPSFADRTLTDSPFAMDFASSYLVKDIEKTEALAAAARLSGVTWVRDRIQWATIEKEKGAYNFEYIEERLKLLDEMGLNLLVMMEAAPSWATADLGNESRVGAYLNNQLSTYKLTKALADYYAGVVDAWELSNEPDGGRAESAEQFSAWFKAAALGINAGDPNAIISNAGFCQPDSQTVGENYRQHSYIHLALANDIMNYSSIFNFHCHTPQSSNHHIPNYARLSYAWPEQAYSTTTLYGANGKPIWITESGMNLIGEYPKQSDILAGAPYIVTSTLQSLSLGTEKHFWFVLSPYNAEAGDFGTFSEDYQPYPTLAAEAVMTKMLGKAEYLGEIPGMSNYNYSRGVLINNGERIVGVLWTFDPNLKYTYTFESEYPVIVTDVMGGQTLVEPVDGKISVNYSGDPVYITFSTPPTEYFPQEHTDAEIEPLTFTEEDKIIITPEFEGYDINDNYTKLNGHLLKDGMTIKVRIGNYNTFNITGSVSITIPGFEVLGTEQTVTVRPFREEFITLTLKQTDPTVELYDFFTFEGSFGEYQAKSVVQLRTMEKVPTQSITFEGYKDGREAAATRQNLITAKLEGLTGTPVVYVNSERWENFTVDGDKIKISLADLPAGKYLITVAILSEGGDYFANTITYRTDGEISVINTYS